MNHHLSLRTKIIVMISVMASLFLVALDQTIISTALIKIVEEFNAFDSLTWIVTAYLLTTTITVPIAGKLSDLFGRRSILLIGVSIFGIGSLLAGMSADVTQLILWRALQGIGGGIITANAFTIVGDLFAARERGRWQGMIGAVFGLSSVIGPLLGGWLTDGQAIFGLTTDWRWTLLINVPIAIAAFTIIAIFCPPLKHKKKPSIDYIGAGLLALLLAIFILAVDNTETVFSGLLEATGLSLAGLRVIMFSAVGVLAAGFVWAEHRAKEPILPLRFFKNRNYVLLITIAMLFGGGFMGSILYLTQFNQQVFGATPTEAGLMLLPLVAGIMVSSIGSGQIISRTGRYKIFFNVGLAIATLCMVGLTQLSPESSYGFEASIMVAMGLGLGVAMPVISLAVQNEFSQTDLGVATSSSQLFRSLGSTIGTAVFGAILTAGIAAQVASLQATDYIKSLSDSPAVTRLGSLDDSNTLLNINTPDIKQAISGAATEQFDTLPESVRDQAISRLETAQDEYSDKLKHAFSDSLVGVFTASAALMSIAFVTSLFLKERELKPARSSDTPGEL